MKKVTLLSLVLILLAASVVPVMAAGNPPNGNGVSNGQGSSGGDQDQTRQQDRSQNHRQNQDRIKIRARDASSVSAFIKSGNQEHGRMRTPFYLQGVIFATDGATGMLTITLVHGNAQVKQYLGTELVLQTNEATQIFKITQGGEISGALAPDVSSENVYGMPGNRVPIPFDQLEVGQKVAIHGDLVDGVFNARLITVYIRTLSGQENVEP